MTSWAAGYVADIGYTAGFYRETAPGHMAFAALSLGGSPGRALQPAAHARARLRARVRPCAAGRRQPDVAFEGYDFNPEHVAHARRLGAGAGLDNLTVSETGFEEAAARGGDNDCDVIAAHGILSWVARPIQDAIVAIVRQRLQPDGMFYVSYNCMPGWAPIAPIRQLMVEVKRRNPGSSERQLARALELVSRLRQGNALYFAANPPAARQLDAMLKMDRTYLAHEYLDEHWDLFWFSDVAARLGEAKLGYVASATLPENLDSYAVPQDLRPLIRADRGPGAARERARSCRQQVVPPRPVRPRHRRPDPGRAPQPAVRPPLRPRGAAGARDAQVHLPAG